jgi:hypothetical protein
MFTKLLAAILVKNAAVGFTPAVGWGEAPVNKSNPGAAKPTAPPAQRTGSTANIPYLSGTENTASKPMDLTEIPGEFAGLESSKDVWKPRVPIPPKPQLEQGASTPLVPPNPPKLPNSPAVPPTGAQAPKPYAPPPVPMDAINRAKGKGPAPAYQVTDPT